MKIESDTPNRHTSMTMKEGKTQWENIRKRNKKIETIIILKSPSKFRERVINEIQRQ